MIATAREPMIGSGNWGRARGHPRARTRALPLAGELLGLRTSLLAQTASRGPFRWPSGLSELRDIAIHARQTLY